MQLTNPPKKYKSNHSIVYCCHYHVIFCTKYRRKFLTNGVDVRLKELILEKQEDYEYEVLDMEIMPDHVHLLLNVNPQFGVIKAVGRIKGYSAHTLRKEFSHLKTRVPNIWTRSKFVSTVGAVTLEVVKRYIENQKNR